MLGKIGISNTKQGKLEMAIMHFKVSRLKQTHTVWMCVCVFSDHVASEAWDTDSSLGVGLEKNSLNSWCSS